MRAISPIPLLAALLVACGPDEAAQRAHAETRFEEAFAARDEERWPDAIDAFQDALALGLDAERDEAARYTLGALMVEHLPPAETRAYFERTLADDPKPQTSHYFLAQAAARAGDAGRAAEHYAAALERDPAHELSALAWGELLEAEGDLEGAYRQLARATTIHPEFALALRTQARVAAALGRHDEATALRARARKADPNTPMRFVYWARALLAAGRVEAAVAELERAVEAMPRNQEVRALLEETRARLD